MNELFVRLTSNKLNWQVPSGHYWDPKYQGRADISYDRQFGFGHEEWLLNYRYSIKGYQYGYIRGIDKKKYYGSTIDKLHFYTVEKAQQQNKVFYLGYILNVEILAKPIKEVQDVFKKYHNRTIKEVEITKGDTEILNYDPLRPILRFRIDDKHFLDQPQLLESFPLSRYKRYNAIEINNLLERILKEVAFGNSVNTTKFVSGKASQKEKYNRNSFHESLSITKYHSKIVNELEAFLSPKYTIEDGNLSIERMSFCGNYADVVTMEKNKSIDIYEIKTTLNGRKNIRDAISQLLDYACHANSYKVNRIVVVSPCQLTYLHSFFNKLKKSVNFNLEYLYFEENAECKFTYLS